MSEKVKLEGKTPGSRRDNSASLSKKPDFSQFKSSPVGQILFLQRTVGNQAVLGLLKSRFIQAKLKIGEPNDKFEQEADRVADQVMRMLDLSKAQRKGVSKDDKIPRIQKMCTGCEEEVHRQSQDSEFGHLELGYSSEEEVHRRKDGIQIQRMCSECEEELHRQPMEEEEELLQTKEVSGSTREINSATESQINNIRRGGQSLPESVQAFFEPRFGQDFSQVRIHTDSQASESANAVNALAYTIGQDVVFGGGQYSPGTESGKKLIAHELTHVVQQKADGSNYIQRDLALTPPNPDVAEPVLSDAETRDAVDFNNRRYGSDVIRLIQDVVGAGVTGTMDEDTVRLIALIQAQFNLAGVDGKVGPDTFDLLVMELSAESAPTDTCMTMFRIRGPRTPMDLRVAGLGLANIFSRFDVEARFSPRCNCSDFEYRQFICGTVNRTRAGVVTNLNNLFTIPGGGLPACPGWVQDGNTTQPQNGRYGHRNHAPRANNRYLDDSGSVDMRSGCLFQAFDIPGLWSIPVVSGDQYDFNMRFFGDIQRGGGRIERKFWALRDTVTIP